MNREMRRNDRQLNTEDTLSILEQGEYGILSTVSADGIPYGVPVSYTYFNQCIYFHCAKNAGLKLENIGNNANVCFTVVGKKNFFQPNSAPYMKAPFFLAKPGF